MKITLNTEQDTYESSLATLRAAFGVKDSPAGQQDSNGTSGKAEDHDFLPNKYNRKKLKQFADWLAPDATEGVRFIAFIAAKGTVVSFDDLIAHMAMHCQLPSLTGQQVGGRMSSVGFAWKALKNVGGPPYDTDYRSRVYRMDSGIAAILAELLGPPSTP